MLRNILISTMIAFSISSTFADNEFENSVPLDLVKALLSGGPTGDVKIYSDLVSSFPSIGVPDELEIMGSIERGYGVAAFFRSELSSSEIESSLDNAITLQEYSKFDPPRMIGATNGFVRASLNYPQVNNRYCHDSLGTLTLTYSEDSGIVTISSNPTNDYRSCADQLAEQSQAIARRSRGQLTGLQQYLPVMEMPETERQRYSPFFSSGGYSGSSSGIAVDANLRIDWSIEEVFSHFSEQITDQSWVLDSESIGSATATVSWTKSPESGTDLIGTLTVLKINEEAFELNFQLTSTGKNNSIRIPLRTN